MEKMISAVDKKASMRNLAVFTAMSLGIMLVMFYVTQILVYDVYGEFVMPDLRLSYSILDIQTIFSLVGQEGMIAWEQVHLLDYILPLAYSLAIAFGIMYELGRTYPERNGLKKLVLIPLLGCIMDYLENLLILSQILSYPNLSEPIIMLASIFTTMKWISMALGFAAILGFFVVIVYRRISSRQ
ncbi:MAG: hypothetical protein C4K48_08235 [Candidatus Thorarchaeota archaeon]|nr:MAG: hypothetical protein C4K48_08235 [Candidatus Thorarchaeota archaeon]